jgi:membrane AbrB-like protein
MSEFSNLRQRLPRILIALAIGIPAGALFSWLDTPIPWMIGPMIAVAACNLMGAKLQSVPFGRQTGQVILGSAVSLYFTATVLAALASHLGAIIASTVSAFVIGGVGALILSRVSGVDGKSTFFASIPGGAMAMAVLAERYGASIPAVAVAHSLRVSFVVIAVPFAVTYSGIPLEGFGPVRPEVPFDPVILVLWLAAGFLIGGVAEKFKFHNGYLLMPIFFGAILTVSGVQLSGIPHWMTDFAQLMFGLILGARYDRDFFIRYKLFVPFALVNAVLILVLSALVGILLSWMFALPIATMLVATAPGGLAEMTLVAQALGIGVPLIVAFHFFRVIIVNMGAQHIFVVGCWIGRKLRPAAGADNA